MAQFDADIKLKVAVENLEQSVRKVEKAFKRIQDYRVKVKIDGQNELTRLGNSFKRLGTLLKGSGVVTAVAAISGSLASLNNLPVIGGGLNTTGLGRLVDQLGSLSNAAVDAAAAQPGLAAGILATSAAAIAFAPQIARAAKDTFRLGRVAAEAAVPIKTLGQYLGSQSAQGILGIFGDLPNAERLVKAYRDRLFELNETVSELGRRKGALKSALDGFNSGSATAEKIARKLVDVNQRLNDELREQADLLRRVRGVNVTELEATKGQKSIETKARARDFRLRQRQEELQVQQALAKLDQRGVSALEEVLGINQNVLNIDRQRTKEKEKQAKLDKTVSKGGRRRGAALEGALVGGGFPLLFGQGPGASIGGALGGGLGALVSQQLSFGLSLIGTVIGQAVDNFIAGAQNISKALRPLTADIKALAAASGLAGTASEKYLAAIEKELGTRAALQLATEELERVVGRDGVKAFQEYGDALNELDKALTIIVTNVLAQAARLLAGPTQNLAGGVSFAASLAQAQQSNDPQIKGLIQEAQKTQSIEKQLILQKEIVRLQEEANRRREVELALTTRIALGQRRLIESTTNAFAIAALSNKTYSEATFEIEKQERAAALIAERTQLRRDAEKDVIAQATLGTRLKAAQLKYETDILEINRRQREAQVRAAQERLQLLQDALSLEEKINNASLERIREEGARLANVARLQSEARDAETSAEAARIKSGGVGLDPIAAKRKEIELTDYLAVREKARIADEKNNAIFASKKTAEELAAIEEKYRFLDEAQALEYRVNRLNLQIELKRLEVAKERAEANAKGVFEQRRDTLQAQLSNPFGGEQLERELLGIAQRNRRLRETADLVDTISANERAAADSRAGGLTEDAARLEKVIAADRERLALRNTELDQVDQLEQAYQRQQQALEKYGFVIDGIASGLSDALTALVTGTETVEEAFSRMFANIGRAFINMATEMLAQQLVLTVLKAFSGGVGVGGNKGFAEGGFVTRPTSAMIGEAGEAEYVIPASKMGEAMTRYNGGRRGESVIPGKGKGEGAGGGNPGGTIVNYNGPILSFNSEDYVPASAVPAIIDEAARKGARAGESRTFATLRNSRSQRSRIGL